MLVLLTVYIDVVDIVLVLLTVYIDVVDNVLVLLTVYIDVVDVSFTDGLYRCGRC